MNKIFFVGNLKSPFIRQDLELLRESNEVDVFDLSVNTSYNIEIFKYWWRCFKRYNYIKNSDKVWIWFANPHAVPFILMGKMTGVPTIVNIGGAEVYAAREINYGNQLNFWGGMISRWIVRNATICISPSPAYEKIIKDLVPTANVVVIPNWVDVNEIVVDNKTDLITTSLCSPSVRNLKGIPTFEEATQGMDALALKGVSHDRLIEILKLSKVYCQLSYTESFGMVVLEAMSCGCVPVVTNRGALPWVIGDCGVVVEYGDVEGIRSGILKALTMDGSLSKERAKFFSRDKKKRLLELL
jgi:glycosyltransferase involved in cell wall biosynthesis